MTEKPPEPESFDRNRGLDEYSRPNDEAFENGRYEEESAEETEELHNQEVVDALNTALKEIADQQKRQILAIVAPASDTVELQPSWNRIYKIGTQNFICATRITRAPGLKERTAYISRPSRSSLKALVGKNINHANLASLKRRTQ
jgi:hypothetical protein